MSPPSEYGNCVYFASMEVEMLEFASSDDEPGAVLAGAKDFRNLAIFIDALLIKNIIMAFKQLILLMIYHAWPFSQAYLSRLTSSLGRNL